MAEHTGPGGRQLIAVWSRSPELKRWEGQAALVAFPRQYISHDAEVQPECFVAIDVDNVVQIARPTALSHRSHLFGQ